MLTKRIIPCLDVMEGRVVKGQNFVNLKDAGGPVENAKAYEEQMADELLLPRHHGLPRVEERPSSTWWSRWPTRSSCRSRWEEASGASPTSGTFFLRGGQGDDQHGGSRAAGYHQRGERDLRQPVHLRGHRCKGATCGFEVYTYGGRRPTGVDAFEWARKVEALGAGEILLTSMDRDGTKIGYDIPLTRAISEAVAIPVIASGGVGTLEHLYEGLVEGKADAVLAASIFHYGSTR